MLIEAVLTDLNCTVCPVLSLFSVFCCSIFLFWFRFISLALEKSLHVEFGLPLLELVIELRLELHPQRVELALLPPDELPVLQFLLVLVFLVPLFGLVDLEFCEFAAQLVGLSVLLGLYQVLKVLLAVQEG